MDVLSACASDCQSRSGARLGRAASAAGAAVSFSLVDRPFLMVRPNLRSDDRAPPLFLTLDQSMPGDQHCFTSTMAAAKCLKTTLDV